jgi:hypothetical protein
MIPSEVSRFGIDSRWFVMQTGLPLFTTMVTADNFPPPEKFEKLQHLTREYSRFSRSATGLGSVLGGAMALAICLLGAFTDPPMWARAWLAAALPFWFLGKSWIRDHYYQRHGGVTQALDPAGLAIERVSQGAAGGIAAVLLLICGCLIVASPQKIDALPLFNKAALIVSPLAGMLLCRRINTPLEMLVTVNLLVQTIILSSGGVFGWKQQGAMFVWAGLLVVIGLHEHSRFRQVEAQLQPLRGTN